MNPYELSQASSDAIQALIDSGEKLDPGSHAGGLLPAILEDLQQQLSRLQQLHSRSWHLLRHNNEHAEFLMARLESLDVLCGRLLPEMSAARSIYNRVGKGGNASNSSRRYGYEFLSPATARVRCCLGFAGDDLIEVLSAMSDELGRWLDHQEAIVEQLSCQAYGVFPRMQSETLEGYQRVPKVMRRIGEALIFGEQRCVVVHGPAGVGKSTLAAFVAANPPECFSDGAAEVRLGNSDEQQLLVKLRHLLLDLNCHRESVQRAASVEDCWRLLQEVVLESSHLIVLDDVCDSGVIERLLRLKNLSCKFLVTCQDDPISHLSSDEDHEHLVCSIKLGFRETAAVSSEILRFHTGMKELPVAASKLLKYCSHHPLSISILGEALRGSWRKQEWKAVVNHFEVCSSGIHPEKQKMKKKKKLMGLNRSTSRSNSIKPLNWMAGVFASIDMGRVGMQQETQQLFDSLAALSWSEPVPVECLKALWGASGNKSPFLVHARELVRRCLIKRRPDFIFYELHELIGVYLERKLPAALDQLLHLAQPGIRAQIAPWLLQFGNDQARQAAGEALRGVLVLDNEELHAKALVSIVEVLKAGSPSSSSSSSSSREEVCRIVGAEIVNLLFRASSSWVYAAITRFISACFSDVDYEEYGRGLVASGLVEKLRSLLVSTPGGSEPGVSPLVKKDVADVLARLASNCSRDRYVVECLIRANLMPELVNLVDSRSGWIHEGAINAVVKLAGLGVDEAAEQLLGSEMLEKLLQLLRSRKQSSKLRAVETIGSLVRSCGSRVVERLLLAGAAEEMEAQLQGCPYEDVRAGCCSLCREMFLVASEGCLERLVRGKVVESLTALLGDSEAEVMRSEAVAALQELVRLRGKPVVDRIVRAAGVGSFVKGLETLPNDAAFTAAYKNLLHSIVDQ